MKHAFKTMKSRNYLISTASLATLILLIFSTSCKKDEEATYGKFFTIKGRVYNDCEHKLIMPNENLKVTRNFNYGDDSPTYTETETITTNAEGYFELTYKALYDDFFNIEPASGGITLYLPKYENKDLGNINLKDDSVNVSFRIKTTKDYSDASLYIPAFGINYQKGPFKDGKEIAFFHRFGYADWKEINSIINNTIQYSFNGTGMEDFTYSFYPCKKDLHIVYIDLDRL